MEWLLDWYDVYQVNGANSVIVVIARYLQNKDIWLAEHYD